MRLVEFEGPHEPKIFRVNPKQIVTIEAIEGSKDLSRINLTDGRCLVVRESYDGLVAALCGIVTGLKESLSWDDING